jgi:hypothetical protein
VGWVVWRERPSTDTRTVKDSTAKVFIRHLRPDGVSDPEGAAGPVGRLNPHRAGERPQRCRPGWLSLDVDGEPTTLLPFSWRRRTVVFLSLHNRRAERGHGPADRPGPSAAAGGLARAQGPRSRAARPADSGLASTRRWSRVATAAAARYTEIFAPERLRVGERGVLTVRLTRTELATSVLPAHLPAGECFQVRLHAPGFAVEGDPVRTLPVTPDADSETAAFYLTAREPSTDGVTVDILRGGVVAATKHVPLPVLSSAVASPATIEVSPTSLAAADIELRILVSARSGASVLSFYLHSPTQSAGYHHFYAGEVTLTGSPQA